MSRCINCRYSDACFGISDHLRDSCTQFRAKKPDRARYGSWNEMGYHKIAVANGKSWRQRLYEE